MTLIPALQHALAYRELEEYDGFTEGTWRNQPGYWNEPWVITSLIRTLGYQSLVVFAERFRC